MKGKDIIEPSGDSELGKSVAGEVICVRQRCYTEKGGVRGTVMIISNIFRHLIMPAVVLGANSIPEGFSAIFREGPRLLS